MCNPFRGTRRRGKSCTRCINEHTLHVRERENKCVRESERVRDCGLGEEREREKNSQKRKNKCEEKKYKKGK